VVEQVDSSLLYTHEKEDLQQMNSKGSDGFVRDGSLVVTVGSSTFYITIAHFVFVFVRLLAMIPIQRLYMLSFEWLRPSTTTMPFCAIVGTAYGLSRHRNNVFALL
jgi:hypothetical protein